MHRVRHLDLYIAVKELSAEQPTTNGKTILIAKTATLMNLLQRRCLKFMKNARICVTDAFGIHWNMITASTLTIRGFCGCVAEKSSALHKTQIQLLHETSFRSGLYC